MHTTTPPSSTSSIPVLAQAAHYAEQSLHQLDSHQLLQGNKSVSIVHNGAVYRLQATKLGKLILTK